MRATQEQVQEWARQGRLEVTMEPTGRHGVMEVRLTRSGRRVMVEVE